MKLLLLLSLFSLSFYFILLYAIKLTIAVHTHARKALALAIIVIGVPRFIQHDKILFSGIKFIPYESYVFFFIYVCYFLQNNKNLPTES